MNAAHFRRLFDYNYWAHRRVWGCVEQLTESQFTQPCDYSIGSIHDQVVHTMAAEWLWHVAEFALWDGGLPDAGGDTNQMGCHRSRLAFLR